MFLLVKFVIVQNENVMTQLSLLFFCDWDKKTNKFS